MLPDSLGEHRVSEVAPNAASISLLQCDFAQRPRTPQFLPPSVQPNPPRRSGHFPVPKIQKDNAYGDKTPAQIEAEIQQKRDALKEQLKELNQDHPTAVSNPDGTSSRLTSSTCLLKEIFALKTKLISEEANHLQ